MFGNKKSVEALYKKAQKNINITVAMMTLDGSDSVIKLARYAKNVIKK